MAYVPEVKHDLFISYAHVDNEPDSHGRRWVSDFVSAFDLDVRQRLGGPRDFSLYFDQSDLQAYDQLQILLENARASAVFVAVLSPSYVAHDWTMKELSEFAAIAGPTRRIVVIEKLPLEHSDPYPVEIEQHKRTQFWRRNEPESYTPSTLTVRGSPDQYSRTLETLGYQVQQLLREMRRTTVNQQEHERRERSGPDRASDHAAKPRSEEQGQTDQAQPASEALSVLQESPLQQTSPPIAAPEVVPLSDSSGDTRSEAAGSLDQTGARMPNKAWWSALLEKSAPAPPLMFELLWPKNESNRGARMFAAIGVTAAIALALSWVFRGVTESPANAFTIILVLTVGSAAFHLMVVALGARLGTMCAIITVIAMWTATIERIPDKGIWALRALFCGIVLGAIVLGAGVERRGRQSYSRLFVITFLASVVALTCLVIGLIILEGISAQDPKMFAVLFGISVGYSAVAAGITGGIWHWLASERAATTPTQTP